MATKMKATRPTKPAIAVDTVLAPVFVYEFLYNSSCCESAAATMSIHKSKKGAERAMEEHKTKIKKEWLEDVNNADVDNSPKYWRNYKWDFDQWWGVRECELLP